MNIEIVDEIKPLVASLLRLKIGYYLRTDDYNLHLLEHNLEKFWTAAISQVNDSDIIYIGNTRVHDDALSFLLNTLYTKNREKFFEFLDITVSGFMEFGKQDRDFTSVLKHLERLATPGAILEKLSNKNVTTKSRMDSNSKNKIFIGHGRSPHAGARVSRVHFANFSYFNPSKPISLIP